MDWEHSQEGLKQKGSATGYRRSGIPGNKCWWHRGLENPETRLLFSVKDGEALRPKGCNEQDRPVGQILIRIPGENQRSHSGSRVI